MAAYVFQDWQKVAIIDEFTSLDFLKKYLIKHNCTVQYIKEFKHGRNAMPTIDIEEDVYEALKGMAEPFIDTPSTVLRRLLKLGKYNTGDGSNIAAPAKPASRVTLPEPETRTRHFVERVLTTEFGRDLQRRGRFTYMFENKNDLVYFQNFNSSAYDVAWYRITPAAREELQKTTRDAYLCLTVPVEQEYYLIPFTDVAQRVKQTGWQRPELEINLDRVKSTWLQLKWDVSQYKKHLSMS